MKLLRLVVTTILGLTSSVFAQEKNILFIAVDDLRPALGCYGDPIAQTPNIDALAAQGIVFNRAYVQESVCGPSRTALLTGKRPSTTGIHDLTTHFRNVIPNVVTLPQHFKNNGYYTQAMGKIFHAAYPNIESANMDDAPSWSEPWYAVDPNEYLTPTGITLGQNWYNANADKFPGTTSWTQVPVRGPVWEAPDCNDSDLYDGKIADKAIQELAERQVAGEPFFMAVGFVRPHLPFVAPLDYYNLYDLNSIPLPEFLAPTDSPSVALPHYSEISAYNGMPSNEANLTNTQKRELIRGYYACVSYVDAQIGRILNQLETLGLADDTIVVLWGDHGFHLGEQGFFAKGTNFERDTRAPLIVKVPNQANPGTTNALVEFADIYPSLVELCDLPAPSSVEGISFAPIVADKNTTWKTGAFSEILREKDGNKNKKMIGKSIRTDRYRFTEWIYSPDNFYAVELYDYQTDPEENVNIAGSSTTLVDELRNRLHAGWQNELPPGYVIPPSPDTVGYWTFEEPGFADAALTSSTSGAILDSSANEFHGTSFTTTTRPTYESGAGDTPNSEVPYTQQPNTQSLRFYGNNSSSFRSYIQIPNDPAFQITGDLTIEAWIKPATDMAPSTAIAWAVVSKGNLTSGAGGDVWRLLWRNTGGIFFQVRVGGTFIGVLDTAPGGLAPAGEWSHIAGTYEKATGTVCVYINGVQVGIDNDNTPNANLETTDQPVYIGRRQTAAAAPATFRGYIDNVRISKVCLTPDSFLNALPVDGDNDTLPDTWEQAHGLDHESSIGDNGAGGDPDNDGKTNKEEYITGTIPKDGSSFFQFMLEPSIPSGKLDTLRWPSLADRIYTIESTNDLNVPFEILQDNIPATATENIFTDSRDLGSETKMFYRIKARVDE